MDNYPSSQSRRRDLDIAKGIGIILVVWAHARGPFSNFIVQFHMPFFFFISGLLYEYKGSTSAEYIKRKCRSLLIPFWGWNFLFYPLFFVLYYVREGGGYFYTALCEIAEIILTLSKVPFLGATWFLPALFWISIGVHAFVRKFSERKYCCAALLIIGVVICAIGFNITFPYKISRTLICSLFYICGYCWKHFTDGKISEVAKNAGACISIVVFWVIAAHNKVSMGGNQYQHKVLFIIGAFAATAFFLRVSQILSSRSGFMIDHLVYLGQNSLDIVIWQFLAFRLTILIQIVCYNLSFKAIVSYPVYDAGGGWWICYLFAGIYGSLAWKYILEHSFATKWLKRVYMIRC